MERLNFVSQDKDFLREYHMREMAMSDWTTGVNTAFEKGVEKGKEMAMSDWTTGVNTAIEKKQIEIAKNLLSKGMAAEFVHETTGLDMEVIQSLEGTRLLGDGE